MLTTGDSSPIGATVVNGGVNFSLYSRQATGVELLLFDKPEDAKPARVIGLDPSSNLTYHYWHLFVPGPANKAIILFEFPALAVHL